MGLFSFLRPADAPPERRDIPLFPLNTVLFPGGRLALRIFEQRYLDMATACMKDQIPFGVCLIAAGDEVGGAAEPHAVGTLAEIASCDMEQLGVLLVGVRGGQRFRIAESRREAGLLRARIDILPEPSQAVPAERGRLLPLLRRIVGEGGEARFPAPHRFDDAGWVGCRLTEILPVQNLAKQKLLELDDPLIRLEILEKYLEQKNLLS